MRFSKNKKNKTLKKKNDVNFKKYFLKSVYTAAAFALICASGYFGYKAYNYFLFKKRVFVLKKISITGAGLTYGEKIKIINKSGLRKNENLADVDLKRVSRLIASYRWIKDVTVYKKYPDKIVIVLKKRKIFAMASYDNNLYYVSRSGYIIQKANYNEGYSFPVVTGLNKARVGGYSKRLEKALVFLEISKNSVLSKRISEVHIERDGGVVVYTDKGLYIKFGIDGYKNKLITLKRLFFEVNKIHIKYKPYINLEYNDEAVIEVNPGSRVLPANYKNTSVKPDVFK